MTGSDKIGAPNYITGKEKGTTNFRHGAPEVAQVVGSLTAPKKKGLPSKYDVGTTKYWKGFVLGCREMIIPSSLRRISQCQNLPSDHAIVVSIAVKSGDRQQLRSQNKIMGLSSIITS